MKTKTKTYLWSILITLAVGGLSALLTRSNMNVYDEINKPALAPPGIVFPIVWGVLYLLMGISVASIIIKGRQDGIYTLPQVKIYALQLAVNFFWSIAFFRFEALWGAFAIIILLLALITGMIVIFKKISPFASSINIPYIIWVIFASYLNFATAFIN